MSPRERNLAVILGALLVLSVVVVGYFLILQPLQAGSAKQAALEKEVADLKLQAEKITAVVPKLNDAKRRSFPSDPKAPTKPGQPAPAAAAGTATRPGASSAKLEYTLLLSRLLAKTKIPHDAISMKERVMDARGVPVLANTKRPAYVRYAWDIEARNIDMWEVHDFLTAYYKVDLLHQITSFSLKRDENTSATQRRNDRKDLTLTITTEAIMIDGVESRPSLVPVPSGFAAVGGLPGFDAIAFNPDPAAGRLINPFRAAPVLAFRELPNRAREPRDYSYLVQKDMFHGAWPAPPKPSFDKLADVTVKAGEPINPVKLSLSGLLPPGAVKWDVKTDANSKLLPTGSVRLDVSKQTPTAALSFKPAEGEFGTTTVSVVATLPDGKELKGSMRVTVGAPAPKDEISAYIFLVNTTVRSDGSASALIRDRYNPFEYEVVVLPKEELKVRKYWFPLANKKDLEKVTPLLVINDEDVKGVGQTATKREFKVVAIDSDGLIVIDVTPPPAKPGGVIGIPIGPAGVGGAKGGGFPGGGGPGGGGPGGGKGFGPGGKPKVADPPAFIPLSGAVGVPSALIPPAPTPKLYRWALGKSLRELKEVDRDTAARILTQAGKTGPINATVSEPVAVAPAQPKPTALPPMAPPVDPHATPKASDAAPAVPVAPAPRPVSN